MGLNYPLSQELLDDLVEAITLFSLQANPRNETDTRQKLQNVFIQLLGHCNNDKKLEVWLTQHQHLFISSCFRLIELILVKGPRNDLDLLLKQISQYPSSLQRIAAELNCPLPELNEETITDLTVNQTAKPMLETASELATTTWTWAKGGLEGLSGFFKADSKPTPAHRSNVPLPVAHVVCSSGKT